MSKTFIFIMIPLAVLTVIALVMYLNPEFTQNLFYKDLYKKANLINTIRDDGSVVGGGYRLMD